MQAQKIAVGPPQSQEMSAQLLVANSSNYPSGSVPVRLVNSFILDSCQALIADIGAICPLLLVCWVQVLKETF